MRLQRRSLADSACTLLSRRVGPFGIGTVGGWMFLLAIWLMSVGIGALARWAGIGS